MEVREKDQADFDLEKMFEMLDTAMTSKDERVQNAFRALLTIIALTKPQDDGSMAADTNHGPLRRMQEDLNNITRRLYNLEDQVRTKTAGQPWTGTPSPYGGQPYTGQGVGGQPFTTWTTTNPGDYGGVATQSPQLWNQK